MDLKKYREVAKWHFGGKQNHKQKTSNKQHSTLISYNSDGLQISSFSTQNMQNGNDLKQFKQSNNKVSLKKHKTMEYFEIQY